jgi:hypothetical protein
LAFLICIINVRLGRLWRSFFGTETLTPSESFLAFSPPPIQNFQLASRAVSDAGLQAPISDSNEDKGRRKKRPAGERNGKNSGEGEVLSPCVCVLLLPGNTLIAHEKVQQAFIREYYYVHYFSDRTDAHLDRGWSVMFS